YYVCNQHNSNGFCFYALIGSLRNLVYGVRFELTKPEVLGCKPRRFNQTCIPVDICSLSNFDSNSTFRFIKERWYSITLEETFKFTVNIIWYIIYIIDTRCQIFMNIIRKLMR